MKEFASPASRNITPDSGEALVVVTGLFRRFAIDSVHRSSAIKIQSTQCGFLRFSWRWLPIARRLFNRNILLLLESISFPSYCNINTWLLALKKYFPKNARQLKLQHHQPGSCCIIDSSIHISQLLWCLMSLRSVIVLYHSYTNVNSEQDFFIEILFLTVCRPFRISE